MNLRNLSVGLRLGLSFSVILCITAVIAGISVWGTSSLQKASDELATHEMEQQFLVASWAADVRVNWVRTEAFLKAIDRDYMDKLAADVVASAKPIDTKARRVDELVQDTKGRAMLQSIGTARKAFSEKLGEITDLHRMGEPNVPTLVDQQLRPLADSYVKGLDELLAGRPLSVSVNQAYGCTIKYKS